MKEKRLNSFSMIIFDDVYDPAEDSLLLADGLAVNPDDLVVDVGSGTGIISLTAIANGARRVIAIDISPSAAKNTLINAKKNMCENKIDVIIGDLLTPIKLAQFNLIVFNPPYLPVEDEGALGRAWSGGRTGRKIAERFITMVKDYISPKARCQMVLSSLMKPEKILKKLSSFGFKYEVNAEKSLFFEKIFLITFFLEKERWRGLCACKSGCRGPSGLKEVGGGEDQGGTNSSYRRVTCENE